MTEAKRLQDDSCFYKSPGLQQSKSYYCFRCGYLHDGFVAALVLLLLLLLPHKAISSPRTLEPPKFRHDHTAAAPSLQSDKFCNPKCVNQVKRVVTNLKGQYLAGHSTTGCVLFTFRLLSRFLQAAPWKPSIFWHEALWPSTKPAGQTQTTRTTS